MYRYAFFVFFLFLNFSLTAQTKLIAHKSHSGSLETFRLAYEHNSPELEGSNFGRIPEEMIQTSVLDSVIYVSDSVAIMVTSRFQHKKTSSQKKLWQTDRDTVYHHPLFSKKHSLDTIKKAMKKHSYSNNEVEKIKFVGYDNKRDSLSSTDSAKHNEQYFYLPAKSNPQKTSGGKSWMMVSIIGLSLLSGTLSWMLSRHRQ